MVQAMKVIAQAMTQHASIAAQQVEAKAQRETERGQREETAAAGRELADFRHHDPPRFKGEHDPDKADLWLQEVEKIFNIFHSTDERKVEYATYLLIGEAECWWNGAKQIMETNQELLTWEVFKEKFLDKYFPKSARAAKEVEFMRLTQGDRTMTAYAAEFESLAKHFRYFRNQMDEEYMYKSFEDGLRYDIKESVEPLEIRQFQVLVEKCKKVENMKRGRPNRGNTGGPVRNQGHANYQNRGRQHPQARPYDHPQRNNEGQPQQRS